MSFLCFPSYVCLDADSEGSVLHAWLAVPGLGDAEIMALRNLFEGEDRLVHGGEESLDEGEKDTEKVEEKQSTEK